MQICVNGSSPGFEQTTFTVSSILSKDSTPNHSSALSLLPVSEAPEFQRCHTLHHQCSILLSLTLALYLLHLSAVKTSWSAWMRTVHLHFPFVHSFSVTIEPFAVIALLSHFIHQRPQWKCYLQPSRNNVVPFKNTSRVLKEAPSGLDIVSLLDVVFKYRNESTSDLAWFPKNFNVTVQRCLPYTTSPISVYEKVASQGIVLK